MTIKFLSSRGTTTSDIARLLGVTEGTVRYHLERLHLSAVDGCSRQLFRAEAVAEAIETWRAAQEDGSIWRRCTTGWSANTIMPAACARSSATGCGDNQLPRAGAAPGGDARRGAGPGRLGALSRASWLAGSKDALRLTAKAAAGQAARSASAASGNRRASTLTLSERQFQGIHLPWPRTQAEFRGQSGTYGK